MNYERLLLLYCLLFNLSYVESEFKCSKSRDGSLLFFASDLNRKCSSISCPISGPTFWKYECRPCCYPSKPASPKSPESTSSSLDIFGYTTLAVAIISIISFVGWKMRVQYINKNALERIVVLNEVTGNSDYALSPQRSLTLHGNIPANRLAPTSSSFNPTQAVHTDIVVSIQDSFDDNFIRIIPTAMSRSDTLDEVDQMLEFKDVAI